MPLTPHPGMDEVLDYLGRGSAGEELISSAFDHLVKIGNGNTATVFAHPSRPDVVVRVTDYPDGWFSYAEAAAQMDVPPPYAPVVHDIVHSNGVWIAIAERLTECADDDATTDLLDLVGRMVFRFADCCEDERELAKVEALMPGFTEFTAGILFGARDLSYENYMMRGDTLIMNDPFRCMPCDVATRLAVRYDLATRQIDVEEPFEISM